MTEQPQAFVDSAVIGNEDGARSGLRCASAGHRTHSVFVIEGNLVVTELTRSELFTLTGSCALHRVADRSIEVCGHDACAS
jgi:hypothetical protein